MKWRKKNPDKEIAYQAKYRASNPEAQIAKGIAYRAANPEKVKAYKAAWDRANPEDCRIYVHNRRVKESASGKLSKGLAEKLLKLQRGKCACCGKDLSAGYHLDHNMPIALGGTNTDDNIQLLCPTCNLQKHAKHPVEFMQSRGFLL
jgi:5-methylcytosine-specific restriction endonuclease McrA